MEFFRPPGRGLTVPMLATLASAASRACSSGVRSGNGMFPWTTPLGLRARNPNGVVQGNIPLPDLTPLLHARDAAEAKVASIGTVNPRPGGLKNSIVQKLKRSVARALDWHVREQVEFNRGVMACVQATIESLNECNQALTL